jgi:hypothetical protein
VKFVPVVALLFTLWPVSFFPQSGPRHEAQLLVQDSGDVRSAKVTLSVVDRTVTIVTKKNGKEYFITIPFSDINRVDYTYSQKSQIWEGLANVGAYSLLCACVHIGQVALFVPYAFSKKKQHWLVMETLSSPVVLKLGQHDYRDLILELSKHGLNVTDSGERPKGSGKPKPA